MRSVNRVTLIGHLAADPELRETKNGIPVANFSVVTNRKVNDGDDLKEIACFHRIVAWRKLGEICSDHLAKGTAVYLEGRLDNHSFEDKEKQKHYRTEIIADKINILTWKKSNSGDHVEIEDVEGDDAT